MKKLEFYGLLFTGFSLLFYLTLTAHNALFLVSSNSLLGIFSILFIFPLISLIIFLLSSKWVVSRIFGGIYAIFMVNLLILLIDLDVFELEIIQTTLGLYIFLMLVVSGGASLFVVAILIVHKIREKDIISVKKTLLEMSTKFTRLKVKEIEEKSGVDEGTIISVITSMIENNQIYAYYFKSSKTVAFDQKANIKEIDNLMSTFAEWEGLKNEKKEKV